MRTIVDSRQVLLRYGRRIVVGKILFTVLALAYASATATIAGQEVTVSYGGVVWSPDGRSLSFTEFRNTGARMTQAGLKMSVYTVRADGTGLKKVTGDDMNATSPVWAQDGTRLFFSAVPVGNGTTRDIFSVRTDGTEVTPLTHGPGGSSSPDASPDGTRVAFNCSPVQGKTQICVMRVDGSEMHALTRDAALAFLEPKWSPDGTRITYYVERGDQKDQVWTMDADGTNPILLTNNIGHNFFPSWSPDGRRVLFCSNRDGRQTLYTMSAADGLDVRPLGAIDSSYARYSPDGRKLALIAGRFPNTKVVVAEADGTHQIVILPRS
jgi:Tol biopolymer transport system component